MAKEQIRFDWLSMLAHSPSWATVTSFDFRWSFAESEVIDVATAIVVVPLLIVAFRRLPLAWAAWSAFVVAIPLFGPSTVHPLMSLPRYVAVLFPLFVATALVVRRRVLYGATLALSVLLLAGLTVQFVTWFWVA